MGKWVRTQDKGVHEFIGFSEVLLDSTAEGKEYWYFKGETLKGTYIIGKFLSKESAVEELGNLIAWLGEPNVYFVKSCV